MRSLLTAVLLLAPALTQAQPSDIEHALNQPNGTYPFEWVHCPNQRGFSHTNNRIMAESYKERARFRQELSPRENARYTSNGKAAPASSAENGPP